MSRIGIGDSNAVRRVGWFLFASLLHGFRKRRGNVRIPQPGSVVVRRFPTGCRGGFRREMGQLPSQHQQQRQHAADRGDGKQCRATVAEDALHRRDGTACRRCGGTVGRRLFSVAGVPRRPMQPQPPPPELQRDETQTLFPGAAYRFRLCRFGRFRRTIPTDAVRNRSPGASPPGGRCLPVRSHGGSLHERGSLAHAPAHAVAGSGRGAWNSTFRRLRKDGVGRRIRDKG